MYKEMAKTYLFNQYSLNVVFGQGFVIPFSIHRIKCTTFFMKKKNMKSPSNYFQVNNGSFCGKDLKKECHVNS